jgi:signal transduction histidine kinase
MVVATDLTERKQNERLEVLVESRTEALRQSVEQLRRSERLASIGTFAAGIAHEINNPLNAILMTAEYALRFASGKDGGDALARIVAEARRGGEIVRGVLQFARQEHKERTRCHLNDVVRNSLDVARTYFAVSGLGLDLALADGLPEVLLNPIEIEQVIVNLVKNAVEAATGSVLVTVRTGADADAVVIEIEDDGPGIPEDVRPLVFDPFFSTRRKAGGTGLGLSICHGIVTSHGGSIGVRSTPGQGTVFTIRLPAARPDA